MALQKVLRLQEKHFAYRQPRDLLSALGRNAEKPTLVGSKQRNALTGLSLRPLHPRGHPERKLHSALQKHIQML
jgi:hypothetical protein